MKALFSEEYYRKFWSKFLEHVPGRHYRNLEKELSDLMKVYEGADIPEQAIEVLRKIRAREIADSCHKLVLDEMRIIKRLESGESSLGYTTQRQENEARFELRTRFEFNCLQLSDFKKKYLYEEENGND